MQQLTQKRKSKNNRRLINVFHDSLLSFSKPQVFHNPGHLLFPVGFAVAAALLAVEGRHGALFPKALRDFPVRQSCGVHFPHHFAFFRAPAEVDPGIRINFSDF